MWLTEEKKALDKFTQEKFTSSGPISFTLSNNLSAVHRETPVLMTTQCRLFLTEKFIKRIESC